MFKDYILNELEKLTAILARLAGFKEEAKPDEFIQLADTTLQNEYNIKLQELLELTNPDFELLLEKQNYHPDKLDALAQLLYMYQQPFTPGHETLDTLKKILVIFDRLEQKHHRSSFENIHKRNSIYQFLQNNYE
ncbi:hypothetical protein [Mucilaginibacter lappiensis]|uniref:Uncharacterized protein n=1 Tax=Mucilaginibacter lappiensis TaxID=354630 RepID=A0A1N6ZGJ5_9SPHI|nr:hypothetical protein [Mucilaginibacter lappiensis]MBB6110201.1 hypothetical protein [Mucilaginibacter lappiensis]MBB6131770.1 hypothetical protein [Mucilaginibacter lappiensis]SIR25915.1 hypothetical protein SAMN05421821_10610 [Mucilaginibacter lappiensis]